MRKAVSDAETLETINVMIANGITVSRILFSLFLFAIPPYSAFFPLLYFLCGLTDVLDGFLARKLHTASKTGEMLDSAADLFFAAAYAVKILPLLCVPLWLWIWTAWIGVVKILGILQRRKTDRKFCIAHSFTNRLTGLLIFLLPLSVHFLAVEYGAALTCTAATAAAIEEIYAAVTLRRNCL